MKKLLIIQKDDSYFLFETLQVIEKNFDAFKEFELTLLVDKNSLDQIYDNNFPLLKGLTTDDQKVATQKYDLSVNLSLNDASWDYHGKTQSLLKIGPYLQDGQLLVKDLWSSYLLTLKAKAPFLTFHLQDVYKNILGIKSATKRRPSHHSITQIVFGMTSTKLFSGAEQEALIQEISTSFPQFPLRDISEVDLVSDLSTTLYIGPATLTALKICEAGARGFFLSSNFQGFNLLPYSDIHLFISSRGTEFKAKELFSFIEREVLGKRPDNNTYSLYKIDHENIFGGYLKSLNASDDNYPIYQSHVVLWNYLLNLYDTNLEVTECSVSQGELLKGNYHALAKFIRLHDYAMASIDTIYQESKSNQADALKIQGHLKNLTEIEKISDQLAISHAFLRPVLDFYRIRRGQNDGISLHDQSQASFLTYSEEHQALQALLELFSVTLKKNEVTI